MIVMCEECGKKYRIDPSKIKGEKARFKCKACNHVITASKPDVSPPEVMIDLEPIPDTSISRTPVKDVSPVKSKKAEKGISSFFGSKKKGIGLRAKMILLFFFVPMIIISATGGLFFWELSSLSDELIQKSEKVTQEMTEERITYIARSIASQCRLYLNSHPELYKTYFNDNAEFKRISVQKVGMTGYSAIYEFPGPDNVWRTWAHPNAKIIGIDMSSLAKPLGANFPGFWKIYTGVKKDRESKGNYRWQDTDKLFRDKFMACVPIEGTPYVIAATTYIHEFTKESKKLSDEAKILTENTRNISFVVFIATLLLIGITVSLYGHKLTARIKELTDVADRISVGELEVEIGVKSNDELGDLAEAIGRMQDSIRLSIKRLRRRR